MNPNLLARFKRGDADAFRELIRIGRDSVFQVGLGFFADERRAHDFARDVFIRAYIRRTQYSQRNAWLIWLLALAVDLGWEAGRDDFGGGGNQGPGQSEEADAAQGAELDPSAARRRALAALRRLPVLDRLCFLLRFNGRLPLSAVAGLLRVPEERALQHLVRGLRWLSDSHTDLGEFELGAAPKAGSDAFDDVKLVLPALSARRARS